MPGSRRGLVAPQNTFLESIVRKCSGARTYAIDLHFSKMRLFTGTSQGETHEELLLHDTSSFSFTLPTRMSVLVQAIRTDHFDGCSSSAFSTLYSSRCFDETSMLQFNNISCCIVMHTHTHTRIISPYTPAHDESQLHAEVAALATNALSAY